VISWGTIIYGAALSGVAAGVAVALALRERRPAVLAAAFFAAAAGPLAWNAILRDTNSSGFFVDAPFAVVPASLQDTGSGVFAFAAAALVFGLGPLRNTNGRRVVVAALLAGLAAFVVDVYLY
jgi:hypothetical protein